MNSRVVEALVSNASPLIFLTRSYTLDLLQHFAPALWVPQPVAAEILQRGPQDLTARALAETSWLTVKPAPAIPPAIRLRHLGAGESSVLALALQHPHTEALMDDLAARHLAASLGLPVRGTLGVVLAAKQRGIIPAARPLLEQMMKAGLYLSQRVLNEALKRVDE